MFRVCLIGPGDINFHFYESFGINRDNLERKIQEIANSLYTSNTELALLPDRGISIEIAKKFKEKGGRVIGLAPLSDKHPGIRHLKQYIETKVNGKNLFDELIDTGDWPKHDLTMGLFGDIILYLGKSPGTEGERNYSIYMYKIIKGIKSGVDQPIETVHRDARAGKNVPYTILVYTPFLKDRKLSYEDEIYSKKFGVILVYVNSSKDIERELKKFSN